MKNFLSIFILTVLFVSCNQKQSEKVSSALADMEIQEEVIPITRQGVNNPLQPLPTANNQDVIKKKIAKDGRIGIQVDNLENSKTRIDTLVKNHGGYYDNESFKNSDWESSFNLKIRVPSSNFESFINKIEAGEGEIKYKEIDARDVTDLFIDLDTRLQNKKNYLKRYNELLAKAQTVKDILEIEEKVRGIEEEIESTTGRIKYLSDLVEYSTLDLTITKQKDFKYNTAKRGNFIEKLKQALSKGWYGLVDFTLIFIKLWPLWLLLTVILYTWRKLRKNK